MTILLIIIGVLVFVYLRYVVAVYNDERDTNNTPWKKAAIIALKWPRGLWNLRKL